MIGSDRAGHGPALYPTPPQHHHSTQRHNPPPLSENRYAEMEMKHKFINHARNVWDRAVTLHPRVDQLWYKYSYMEEASSRSLLSDFVCMCVFMCVLGPGPWRV